MGWIGHNGYIDFFVCDSVQSVVRHSQMVFHISGPFVFLVEFGVKLTEDVLQWFSADIGQHIKSPSETEQKVVMGTYISSNVSKSGMQLQIYINRTF